jgi:hypothetical protein
VSSQTVRRRQRFMAVVQILLCCLLPDTCTATGSAGAELLHTPVLGGMCSDQHFAIFVFLSSCRHAELTLAHKCDVTCSWLILVGRWHEALCRMLEL